MNKIPTLVIDNNSSEKIHSEAAGTSISEDDVASLKRRAFLQSVGVGAATLAVGACSGASASGGVTMDGLAQPQSSAAFSTEFQLISIKGGANLPFTLGCAFKKGDVPIGMSVVGRIPQTIGNYPRLQVIGKNWWPDGSLKFAIISGQMSLDAGVPKVVTLTKGPPADATVLTTSDLKATGVMAAISATNFGTATWSERDWDAPFQVWISGSQMSSWLYRQPIGADRHLVAWLEVRLYANGAVEVLPWVENGYLNVAGVSNKNATYSFTLGGAPRFSASFDLPHHCRAVLGSEANLTHWLGADPGMIVRHDTAYLQNTRLVPAYRAVVSPTATLWARMAKTYTPLARGNYPLNMGSGGYDASIGLLPEWDVAYLVSGADPRAYTAVVINGYGVGRYGIHYRDEITQRPLRFSNYPKLVVSGTNSAIMSLGTSSNNTSTPPAGGTAPQSWASSHHPSVGFMAYLLTGRFYFMEEVQFAATLNYLKQSDVTRQYSKGIFMTNAGSNTTRGAAWSLRTLAQAACVTPDSDAVLRAEFLASMEANINYYHTMYVAQPNNPHGFVIPYSDYTGLGDSKYFEASWMQDFFNAACGYALDMGLALSETGKTKLREFFFWKSRSILGRFGGAGATEFCYRDAAVYTISVAPADKPDFLTGTGPWYQNWGQIYSATLGRANDDTNASGTSLRGGNFPDSTSYWGNLQPALAYAVEHNVPGALAAYNRMLGASNWGQLASGTNGWNAAPVWSVKPRNI